MMHKFIVTNLEQLPSVAEAITDILENTIVLFYGDMGTGKTTLIKHLAEVLGVEKEFVVSPTFALVNVYNSRLVGEVYHFDLYRLKSQEELLDIGFEDYLNGQFCFIEWPQLAESFFETHFSTVSITVDNTGKRQITVENH
jgi:tRNA threonylcarbamoyladenosine biosynthesis protein TsaE